MAEHYIQFENVTKSYGTGNAQINALSDVSFEINQGEFCIFVTTGFHRLSQKETPGETLGDP